MILNTKVDEIMTREVFSVELEDTIHKADEIIREEKVKQLPVLENNKLVGLITERTLMEYTLRQLYDFDDEYGEIGYNKINDFQDVMAKNVRIIYPEDSMHKALELMSKYKLDCLPVVDWQNNLVGILTSNDLLLFFRNKLTEK